MWFCVMKNILCWWWQWNYVAGLWGINSVSVKNFNLAGSTTWSRFIYRTRSRFQSKQAMFSVLFKKVVYFQFMRVENQHFYSFKQVTCCGCTCDYDWFEELWSLLVIENWKCSWCTNEGLTWYFNRCPFAWVNDSSASATSVLIVPPIGGYL